MSGPQPLDAAPGNYDFFPRYDFQLEANLITGDDPNLFRWDAHFGGEMDVVNYVNGRVTVLTDYEAVMSDQLRPFDPNQGNYTLEPAASWFVGKNEVAFVFHHVSRHLSDRPKDFAIAFNVIEARYLRRFQLNGKTLSVKASAGKLAQHSYVDYTWHADWDVMAVHPMNPRVQLYARTTGEMFGTDPAVRGRSDVQHTVRIEVGPRIIGTKADMEWFFGFEHRADAYQVNLLRPIVNWGIVGFRIVSK